MHDEALENIPFRYCPACAGKSIRAASEKSMRCEDCGFVYYHNCAAAVGMVVRFEREVLFIERGLDPARGLLDVPGGFVDYGETLEEAVLRETLEETGVSLDHASYLASFPNRYAFGDVLYRTCDVYFETRVSARPAAVAADDAAAIVWRDPRNVEPAELAFDSTRQLHRILCTPGTE